MKERVPLEQSGGELRGYYYALSPGYPSYGRERIGGMPARIKIFSQGGKINGIYPSNTIKGIGDSKVTASARTSRYIASRYETNHSFTIFYCRNELHLMDYTIIYYYRLYGLMDCTIMVKTAMYRLILPCIKTTVALKLPCIKLS